MLALDQGLCGGARRLERSLEDGAPLKGLAVVQDLLSAEALERVLQGCRNASYGTYCGYSKTGNARDIINEFCAPCEQHAYVTIHHRPTSSIPELEETLESMRSKEVVEALSELTGLSLSSLNGKSVLTLWQPGDFLNAHSDLGAPDAPNKLGVSLSLCSAWDASFGGTTTFAWPEERKGLTLSPRVNRAVLFTPHPKFVHWVNRVNDHAPKGQRFTWSLFYR